MLASLIYRIKDWLEAWPALYRVAFAAVTFNRTYFRQRLEGSQYPSAFGGQWTDRDDYPLRLSTKLGHAEVDEPTADLLDEWRESGFIRLAGAISSQLIDQYFAEIAELKARTPSPLRITSISLTEPAPYSAEAARENYSVRTVDDYFFCESSREMLFDPAIARFLETVFEAPGELTQSLNFEYGSEQAVHQDTAFVSMNAPMSFAGVWIALEDVRPGSGELVYYPGSHRWQDFRFSRYFKHYDASRDGEEQLQHWYRWIHEEAEKQGSELQHFHAAKGDVLIWHAGLAHGGAPVTSPGLTRHSLVGHFCAQGVRPLYHYYKPGQRRAQDWRGHRYYSSYYQQS